MENNIINMNNDGKSIQQKYLLCSNGVNSSYIAKIFLPLAGRPEGRPHDGVHGMLSVRVGQHGGVILGAQVGLDALACGSSSRENVLAGRISAHKRNR